MPLDRAGWQKAFQGSYQGDVEFCVPMKNMTTLGIGGDADVVTWPAEPISLRNMLVHFGRNGIPFRTLGWGSNMLVSDRGIEGVLISLKSFGKIEVLREGAEDIELFVEAGVPLQKLVNFCRDNGYSGVEGLAGIPGTLGGAICGNAGSFGVEIKDVLVSVAIMDADGRLERYKAEGLGFGYRTSDILPGDIVLSANLRLLRGEIAAVAGRTEKFFAEKRRRQPLSEKSAGCVFKNPNGSPAGKLIEEAGCKGMKVGGIEVSTVHSNFFVNTGNGSAGDYLGLMRQVSEKVRERQGIVLEPEIRVIGRG